MKKFTLLLLLTISLYSFGQIPTNGLVAYYPFNGNANDESGNDNNGIVHGATLTEDRFGNSNSAYVFPNNTDDIEVLNSAELQLTASYTISLWINPLSSYGSATYYYSILNKWGTNYNASYAIVLTLSGHPEFITHDGNNYALIGKEPVPLNQWTNITVVQKHDTGMIYINGVLDTIRTGMGTPLIVNNSLSIGANMVSYASDCISGKLDDIIIYSRALNSSEINSLFYQYRCYETVFDTITVYDTVPVYDTTYTTVFDTIPVYEKIAVTDTLLINAVLTDIEPPLNQNTIKAYPNPTKDRITIDNGNYTKMAGYKLKILNIAGNVVFESYIDRQQFDLDLNTFGGKGIYYLQIEDDSSQIIDIKKIILR